MASRKVHSPLPSRLPSPARAKLNYAKVLTDYGKLVVEYYSSLWICLPLVMYAGVIFVVSQQSRLPQFSELQQKNATITKVEEIKARTQGKDTVANQFLELAVQPSAEPDNPPTKDSPPTKSAKKWQISKNAVKSYRNLQGLAGQRVTAWVDKDENVYQLKHAGKLVINYPDTYKALKRHDAGMGLWSLLFGGVGTIGIGLVVWKSLDRHAKP
jgi:hypothetical protein